MGFWTGGGREAGRVEDWAKIFRLSHDFSYRLAEIDFEAFAAGDFQAAVVEAEEIEDGGVDVGDVMAVFDGVETELVGDAVRDSAFDAAAGEPCAEA